MFSFHILTSESENVINIHVRPCERVRETRGWGEPWFSNPRSPEPEVRSRGEGWMDHCVAGSEEAWLGSCKKMGQEKIVAGADVVKRADSNTAGRDGGGRPLSRRTLQACFTLAQFLKHWLSLRSAYRQSRS